MQVLGIVKFMSFGLLSRFLVNVFFCGLAEFLSYFEISRCSTIFLLNSELCRDGHGEHSET